jgi:hypothetical protein
MRLTRGSSLPVRKAAGFAGARRRAERHTRLCALRPSLYANVKFRSDGTVRPTMRLGGDALGHVRYRCCWICRRGLSRFVDESCAFGACVAGDDAIGDGRDMWMVGSLCVFCDVDFRSRLSLRTYLQRGSAGCVAQAMSLPLLVDDSAALDFARDAAEVKGAKANGDHPLSGPPARRPGAARAFGGTQCIIQSVVDAGLGPPDAGVQCGVPSVLVEAGLGPSGVDGRCSVLGFRGSAVQARGSATIEAGLGPSLLRQGSCLSYDVVGLGDAGLGPFVCEQVFSRAGSATIVDAGLGPSGVVFAELEPYDGGALHATFAPLEAGLGPFVTGPPT